MTGKRPLRQGQSAGLEGMNDPHMHERGMLERIDHPDSAEPDHRLAQHGDLRRLARPFVQRDFLTRVMYAMSTRPAWMIA
jgi:hypothetical protein